MIKMPVDREDFEYKMLSVYRVGIEETINISGITLRDNEINDMVRKFAEHNNFKKCKSL